MWILSEQSTSSCSPFCPENVPKLWTDCNLERRLKWKDCFECPDSQQCDIPKFTFLLRHKHLVLIFVSFHDVLNINESSHMCFCSQGRSGQHSSGRSRKHPWSPHGSWHTRSHQRSSWCCGTVPWLAEPNWQIFMFHFCDKATFDRQEKSRTQLLFSLSQLSTLHILVFGALDAKFHQAISFLPNVWMENFSTFVEKTQVRVITILTQCPSVLTARHHHIFAALVGWQMRSARNVERQPTNVSLFSYFFVFFKFVETKKHWSHHHVFDERVFHFPIDLLFFQSFRKFQAKMQFYFFNTGSTTQYQFFTICLKKISIICLDSIGSVLDVKLCSYCRQSTQG